MGMLKEFRDFAMRGNVVDMAVGIIIGGAFGKIVSSLVNDIVMPPFGLLLKDVPFKDMAISLRDGQITTADLAAGVPTINIGTFINTVLDFVVVAFVIFIVIRWMNRLLPTPVTTPAGGEKDLPLLPIEHSCRGDALPPMHLGIASRGLIFAALDRAPFTTARVANWTAKSPAAIIGDAHPGAPSTRPDPRSPRHACAGRHDATSAARLN